MTKLVVIEVLKNRRGKWFFRAKAGNGNILFHSETYQRRIDAIKTARLIAFSNQAVSVRGVHSR